ncbi:hypothetical protein MRX96_028864 [Rhipicephalus microplus]
MSTQQSVSAERDQPRATVAIVDEQVSIPTHASILVSMIEGTSSRREARIETNKQFLLSREVGITREVVSLFQDHAEDVISNFSSESNYLSKGIAVSFSEKSCVVPAHVAMWF